MESLHNKSWTSEIPSSKKYLSRMLSYQIATNIDTTAFEVGFEIPLSKEDPSEPDVVVFDKRKGWCSIMAIEICSHDEITDMLVIARELMEKHSLLDFFIFDQEYKNWYNIRKGNLGYFISSNATFMGITLGPNLNG